MAWARVYAWYLTAMSTFDGIARGAMAVMVKYCVDIIYWISPLFPFFGQFRSIPACGF
jgi:hypothetical protein